MSQKNTEIQLKSSNSSETNFKIPTIVKLKKKISLSDFLVQFDELIQSSNPTDQEYAFYTLTKYGTEINGNSDALVRLAECYRDGVGTRLDLELAEKYFYCAKEMGHTTANILWLNFQLQHAKTKREQMLAFSGLSRLGEQNAYAAILLGQFYESSSHGSPNTNMAVFYYNKAGLLGDARGYYYAGMLHFKYHTNKVLHSKEQSHEAFLAAAKLGDVKSQEILAIDFYFGTDTKKDHQQAFYWASQAAAQNSADGHFFLGEFHRFGIGVEKNLVKAVEHYNLAAELGSAEAQYNLACLYEMKMRAYSKKMMEALQTSAYNQKRSSTQAQVKLGSLLLLTGTQQKEIDEGVGLLSYASQKGNAEAAEKLEKYLKEKANTEIALETAVINQKISSTKAHKRKSPEPGTEIIEQSPSKKLREDANALMDLKLEDAPMSNSSSNSNSPTEELSLLNSQSTNSSEETSPTESREQSPVLNNAFITIPSSQLTTDQDFQLSTSMVKMEGSQTPPLGSDEDKLSSSDENNKENNPSNLVKVSKQGMFGILITKHLNSASELGSPQKTTHSKNVSDEDLQASPPPRILCDRDILFTPTQAMKQFRSPPSVSKSSVSSFR